MVKKDLMANHHLFCKYHHLGWVKYGGASVWSCVCDLAYKFEQWSKDNTGNTGIGDSGDNGPGLTGISGRSSRRKKK